LGFGVGGLGNGALGPTPNPQSPIPNPQLIIIYILFKNILYILNKIKLKNIFCTLNI
jgi:hypothetical protein